MLTQPLDYTTPIDFSTTTQAIEDLTGENLLAPESLFQQTPNEIISFTPSENGLEFLGDDLTVNETAQILAPETDIFTIPATNLLAETTSTVAPAVIETTGAIAGIAETLATFLFA